jgi:hypothetical protein
MVTLTLLNMHQVYAACSVTETGIRPIILTVDTSSTISPTTITVFNLHGDFKRYTKGITTPILQIANTVISASEMPLTGVQTASQVVLITSTKVHIFDGSTGAVVRSASHGYTSLTSVVTRRAVVVTSG